MSKSCMSCIMDNTVHLMEEVSVIEMDMYIVLAENKGSLNSIVAGYLRLIYFFLKNFDTYIFLSRPLHYLRSQFIRIISLARKAAL